MGSLIEDVHNGLQTNTLPIDVHQKVHQKVTALNNLLFHAICTDDFPELLHDFGQSQSWIALHDATVRPRVDFSFDMMIDDAQVGLCA